MQWPCDLVSTILQALCTVASYITRERSSPSDLTEVHQCLHEKGGDHQNRYGKFQVYICYAVMRYRPRQRLCKARKHSAAIKFWCLTWHSLCFRLLHISYAICTECGKAPSQTHSRAPSSNFCLSCKLGKSEFKKFLYCLQVSTTYTTSDCSQTTLHCSCNLKLTFSLPYPVGSWPLI